MIRRLSFLALFALAVTEAQSQASPYVNPPKISEPVYRVRYEPRENGVELIYPVQYTIWIPPSVTTLRGVIVHQHGCGVGSCLSGQTGVFDLHWRALAKRHDCALLSPSYEQPEGADCQMWCDPRNGSASAFLRALNDLGDQSGHPELASVPWALWGHSGGGHWAGGMVALYPDRVIAAWLRSGVPFLEPDPDRPDIQPHEFNKSTLAAPMMLNLGTEEGVTVRNGRFAGVWPSNQAFFNALRPRGALIGIAVDPLTSHQCGNQRYLAIPWLHACLSARLPEEPGAKLRPMPTESQWLAPAWDARPVAQTEFSGDASRSIWLPNASIAKAWRQYVENTEVTDETPPPAPYNLELKEGVLTWDADADLESGLSHFVILRNGQEIASVPEDPSNRFGRPVLQGLQYSDTPTLPITEMRFAVASTNAHGSDFHVIAVNTVGLRSDAAISK